MSHRLAMRAKSLVGLVASRGWEPDEATLHEDEALALRDVESPQEVGRRQAADLGCKLNVELVAQDGQGLDHVWSGVEVAIHAPRH